MQNTPIGFGINASKITKKPLSLEEGKELQVIAKRMLGMKTTAGNGAVAAEKSKMIIRVKELVEKATIFPNPKKADAVAKPPIPTNSINGHGGSSAWAYEIARKFNTHA